MFAILDSGESNRRLVFRQPLKFIVAERAQDVPGALQALLEAQAAGWHLVGWLSYELGYALEARLAPLMPPQLEGPLLRFGVFADPEVLEAAQAEAGARVAKAPGVPLGRAYAGPLTPEWQAADYAPRFRRVHDYIRAGDIYQANLSYRASFAFAGDPRAFYEQLRAGSQARYCAYIDDAARQILSISPELFFRVSPDGTVASRPMKGTIARSGGDARSDAAERAALAASDKDRAENLMIVDLIRNDLGRIAQNGSVGVEDLFKVETYPTLHTMVSTVHAKKRADCSIIDLIAALFPCGSITGAPKIRAMEILRELEASPRGVYCGAVGHIAPDGAAQFNVAIRTLTIAGGRGSIGLGGGVVHDSEAAREYAECQVKARFLTAGRRPIELIETLRHDEAAGFLRLASHFQRMAASAGVFGLCFDERLARQALDAAVAGKAGPLRVRLALDEAGQFQSVAVPLPPNPAQWTYAISPERVYSGDELLRHKTSWRELYEGEVARLKTDEVLFLNERGELAEGARSNVFVRRKGVLLTPPLAAGLLPGRLREELLAKGEAVEATLTEADLQEAQGEVYFGNSLRGLVRAVRAGA